MSQLRLQQSKFALMVAKLIIRAYELGYEVTWGDGFRDPRVFGKYGVKMGYGSATSDHKLRLAVDINLFRDGVWLTKTEDHEPLGLYWESLGGVWGGRFKDENGNPDGNHYSGRKP